jgi:nucleotide-binding universal stress UspA family protein
VTASHFDPNYGEPTARADVEQILREEHDGAQLAVTSVRIEKDLPARAILAAAGGAWMVVVGSRGLGGFKGLLLGSVSQQVAHHAASPVLIVPGADRG